MLFGCLQECQSVGIRHLLPRLNLPGSQEEDLVVPEDPGGVVVTGVVEEGQEREDPTAQTLQLHLTGARPHHHPVYLVAVTPHSPHTPSHGHMYML